MNSRLRAVLVGLVSLFIFGRAVHDLRRDVESDEYTLGSSLKEVTFAEVIAPFKSAGRLVVNTNQIVANVSSYLSTKIFGLTEATLRYPALFFTAIFLIALFLISRRLATLSLWIVYGNLVVNPCFSHYAHAAKGYISLMASSTFLLYLVIELEKEEEKLNLIPLFLSAFLCIFSHSIGALYFLFVMAALAIRGRLKGLVSLIGLVPIALAQIFYHHFALRAWRDLYRGQAPVGDVLTAAGNVLGIAGDARGRIITVLLILLLAGLFAGRRRREARLDLVSWIVLISVASMGSLILALRPRLFDERFFLVFLVPVLIWAGETVSRIPRAMGRAVVFGALSFALFFEPVRSLQRRFFSYGVPEYRDFISRVYELTSPADKNCYRISGRESTPGLFKNYYYLKEARWTKDFFFPRSPDHCPKQFEIQLFGSTWKEDSKLIWSDEHGRRLVQLDTNSDN